MMLRLIITLFSVLFVQISNGQQNRVFKDGKGFSSVFQQMDKGEFLGTANGVLFIKTEDDKDLILDFQGSNGALEIQKDLDEVYDVSTKSYYAKTTSRQSEIRYETYGLANGIGIKLNEQWFELTAIDGGCDLVIDGIKYTYKAESRTEYLVLVVEKELELSNWQYLIRTEHKMNPNNIDELREKKKKLKLLPNSAIVFAIKRK